MLAEKRGKEAGWLIDKSRLNRIGIDRIVINNFTITNFDKLEKKEVTTNFEYIEKIEHKNRLFNLNYSINLKANGEIYTVSSLELNPNRNRDGHNIYNSSVKELLESLEEIRDTLNSYGITIDFINAKIKEIEINVTFEQEFFELEEVLLLVGRANYQKAIGMYSFFAEDIPAKIKKERSLYINSKMQDFRKDVSGKVIKFYDKTFELLTSKELSIDIPLTRIEVVYGRDYYRNAMDKENLTNSLYDLLTNGDILKKLFIESLEQELITKPEKYLETLKKNLSYNFMNFRRNERVKRLERKRYKEKGKEIPEHLREERGVFEYLDHNSWIFDYKFLLEIIEKNISSKHRKDYQRQVLKKYLNKNNLAIYEKLLKAAFLR